MASKRLKLTLTRSIIGLSPKHEATVKALGLRHINQTVVHDDTESIRGMVFAVQHMLKVDHEA